MDDKKKMTELGSLAHFGHLTIEGTMGVVERETVLSRKLTVAEVLEYESGSTDIRYKDDKRRKHKNNPKRPLASADKTYVKKGGHIDVKGSVLKDGGGNLSQQRASSTLFFNSESIVHRCTNGQHVVKINYNLLKLTEEQRLNLQTILKGRDGLEAFKFIPGSTQQRRDCIMQLAFESAYSAKNLIIALKQALSSYQEVSFSPQECFSETPWLEAITYKEEAGEYLVMIDYPPLRLTQVERTHLQVILEKIKKDNFDCEPEKTVTSKSCIQQLVFVSEKSAQACLAKLYASMESGLQEDELLQEGQNEGKEEAYSPRQVSFAANPL